MDNDGHSMLLRSLQERVNHLETVLGKNTDFQEVSILAAVDELELKLKTLYRRGQECSRSFMELLLTWYENRNVDVCDKNDQRTLHAQIVVLKYNEILSLINSLKVLNATYEEVLLSGKLVALDSKGNFSFKTTMLTELSNLFKDCNDLLIRSLLAIYQYYKLSRTINASMYNYNERLSRISRRLSDLQHSTSN